jgi:hypothetical protein
MPSDNLAGSSNRCLAAREPILSRCARQEKSHRTIDPDALKIPARKGGIYTSGERRSSISG